MATSHSHLSYRILTVNAAPLLPLLQSLLDRSDSIVNAARSQVNSTPYATDVQNANGATVEGIHVHDDKTFSVWFHLNDMPHRCLAVKFEGGMPVDVYLDEP